MRRQKKVEVVADTIPEAEPYGDEHGEMLVLGWGSTFGAIRSAVDRLRERALPVSHLHLNYLNPFPTNLGEVLLKFRQVLIPELNLGQLVRVIRAEFLVDAMSYSKVQGKPFTSDEIEAKILENMKESKHD